MTRPGAEAGEQSRSSSPVGLPLAGKRVVVTRTRAQAAALSTRLAALGAEPILFPTIEIGPAHDYGPLDSALRSLEQYHWVIFTSVNAVTAVWDRLAAMGEADGIPAPVQVAAIGPATAQALEKRGVAAAHVPEEYVAEALAASLGQVEGQHMLLPHAEQAREVLADELRIGGALVDEIVAYRTLPAAPDPHGLAELRRGVDAITFTSASTARNFERLLASGAQFRAAAEGGRPIIACIGPATAAGARAAGLPVDVVAAEYTLDGLVAALAEYFGQPER